MGHRWSWNEHSARTTSRTTAGALLMRTSAAARGSSPSSRPGRGSAPQSRHARHCRHTQRARHLRAQRVNISGALLRSPACLHTARLPVASVLSADRPGILISTPSPVAELQAGQAGLWVDNRVQVRYYCLWELDSGLGQPRHCSSEMTPSSAGDRKLFSSIRKHLCSKVGFEVRGPAVPLFPECCACAVAKLEEPGRQRAGLHTTRGQDQLWDDLGDPTHSQTSMP